MTDLRIDEVVAASGCETRAMRPWYCALLALIVLLAGAPAFAQRLSVSASLIGDVVTLSGPDLYNSAETSPSGNALGFAVRVRAHVGSNWGLEGEYGRPRATSKELSGSFALDDVGIGAPGPFDIDVLVMDDPTFPSVFSYDTNTRRRFASLSAGAWARQDLSPRVSLVYVGGIAFHHTRHDASMTYSVTQGPRVAQAPTTTSMNYSFHTVRPFAGLESPVVITEHLSLVPGIRLYGLEDGWLVRPSVGLAWAF